MKIVKYKGLFFLAVVLIGLFALSCFLYVSGNAAGERMEKERPPEKGFTWAMAPRFASSLERAGEDSYCLGVGNSYSLINLAGEELTSEEYAYLDGCGYEEMEEPLSAENTFIIARKGRFGGFIDGEGRERIPFVYSDLTRFSGNYAAAKKEKTWTIIDKEGNTLFTAPKNWKFLYPTAKEGIFEFQKGEYAGLCDQSGVVLLPADTYTECRGYSQGYWMFTGERGLGVYLDDSLRKAFNGRPVGGSSSLFSEGYAFVEMYEDALDLENLPESLNVETRAYMDTEGNFLWSDQWPDMGGPFKEERAVVPYYSERDNENQIAVIDKEGNTVFEVLRKGSYYMWQEYYSEGYLPLCVKKTSGMREMPAGMYAYFDINGRQLTDGIFDNVRPVKDGLAVVCIGNQWGVIRLEEVEKNAE